MSTGINFSNYDDIPVEATGHDVPEAIEKVRGRWQSAERHPRRSILTQCAV